MQNDECARSLLTCLLPCSPGYHRLASHSAKVPHQACMHKQADPLLRWHLHHMSPQYFCNAYTSWAVNSTACLQSRRTDDPTEPDRRQSFSVSARPGPGIMVEPNPTPPVRHLVRDPALQAMATEAASKVADAVRYCTDIDSCTHAMCAEVFARGPMPIAMAV